jgi:putative FmdB family regulatory protein
MPLFDFLCLDCGKMTEILIMSEDDVPRCQDCSSTELKKMLSAHSSYSGSSSSRIPGPGDTSCCGSTPVEAGCAGPGSCCGKKD